MMMNRENDARCTSHSVACGVKFAHLAYLFIYAEFTTLLFLEPYCDMYPRGMAKSAGWVYPQAQNRMAPNEGAATYDFCTTSMSYKISGGEVYVNPFTSNLPGCQPARSRHR